MEERDKYPEPHFIDNNRLLAVIRKARVQVWNVEKGTQVRTWKSDDLVDKSKGLSLIEVALSPSGEKMAWLGYPDVITKEPSCTVFLYDTKSGKLLREVKGLRDTDNITLIDEGDTLVLAPRHGSFEPPTKVHRLGKYPVVHIPTGKVKYYCDFHPSDTGPSMRGAFRIGNSLYTLDNIGMIRWDFATGKKLDAWTRSSLQSAWSADGKRTAAARGARLQLCGENFKPLAPAKEIADAPNVQFLPDGRLRTRGWVDAWFEERSQLDTWDIDKGQIVTSLHEPDRRPPDKRFPTVGQSIGSASCDAEYTLAAYRDKEGFAVMNLLTKKIVRLEMRTETDSCWEPSMSEDGARVLVVAKGKESALIRWFDPHTGKEQGAYSVRNNEIKDPESPRPFWFDEGKTIRYLMPDGRLVLIDCASRKVRFVVGFPVQPVSKKDTEPSWHQPWYYRDADHFILGERTGRTGDGSVSEREFAVWGAKAGQLLRRFKLPPPGSNNPHLSGRLSRDGRWLAAAIYETEHRVGIALFETATGRRLGELRAPNFFSDFDFAPDGKTLAMSCDDTTVLIWDLERPLGKKPALPAPRTPAEAETHWKALADPDAEAMAPSLWALVRAPGHSLPLLQKELRPARLPDADRLRQLIARLGHANFNEREAASKELTRLGEISVTPLQEALQLKTLSLEQRRRIEELLPRVETGAPSCLRELRAIEVLERIGTAEARKIVESVATGDADALLTREARLVLGRWPGKK
jgi:WD40 repeat protein